jgi:endonuclease V-like protein UPF0215 family
MGSMIGVPWIEDLKKHLAAVGNQFASLSQNKPIKNLYNNKYIYFLLWGCEYAIRDI